MGIDGRDAVSGVMLGDGRIDFTEHTLKKYGLNHAIIHVIGTEVWFHPEFPPGQIQYWHKDERFHCGFGIYHYIQFCNLKKLMSEKCHTPLTAEQAPYDQETDVACNGPCEACMQEKQRDAEDATYQRGYQDALKVCADDVKDAVENNGLRFNAQEASYYESRARDEVARLRQMNANQVESIQTIRQERDDCRAELKAWQNTGIRRTADVEQIRELQAELYQLKQDDREWDLLIQDRDEALEEVRQLKDTNAKLLKSNGGWMEAYNHLDQDFEDKMEDRKLYIKDLLARLGRQSDTIRELQQVTAQAFTVAHGRGPDKDDVDF